MGTIGLAHPLMATPELPRLILVFFTSTTGEPETQFCQREGAGAGNRGGPERAIQADSLGSVSLKATKRALGSLPCAREPWLRLASAVRSRSKRDSILGAQPHRLPEPAFAPPAAAGKLKTVAQSSGPRRIAAWRRGLGTPRPHSAEFRNLCSLSLVKANLLRFWSQGESAGS